jgi:hypothetical protein
MKTFAANEKRLSAAACNARPYVHHPIGPAQLSQQAAMRKILRPDEVQAKPNTGVPPLQKSENEEPEEELQLQPEEEEEEPIQAKFIQRQPDNEEEEEPVQTKPLSDMITPLVQRQEEPEEEEEEAEPEKEEEPEESSPILESVPTQDADELGEEEEPIQAKLIQRQPDNKEEEEPIQTKRIQRKMADMHRPQPSRFGYIGPEAKAQQAEIHRILRSTDAQAKLTIDQPNDKYEQEADRVVDQVMSMPDPKLQRQPENEEEEETLQTKPLADQITPLVQRQEELLDEEDHLIRLACVDQTADIFGDRVQLPVICANIETD